MIALISKSGVLQQSNQGNGLMTDAIIVVDDGPADGQRYRWERLFESALQRPPWCRIEAILTCEDSPEKECTTPNADNFAVGSTVPGEACRHFIDGYSITCGSLPLPFRPTMM